MTESPSSDPIASTKNERGVALILTLLILSILFVVILQLKYSTSIKWSIARNQQDDIVMEMVARGCIERTKAMLILDYEQDQEQLESGEGGEGGGEGGAGGFGGGAGGFGGGALGGGGLGGENSSPSTTVDSLDEEWAAGDNVPSLGTEAEVRVMLRIVDEDRKFNLLQIFTPDVEDEQGRNYRERAKERLVRLLDLFREGKPKDLDASDAETIVENIVAWCGGDFREELNFPRPPLKEIYDPEAEEEDPEDDENSSGIDDAGEFSNRFDEEDQIIIPLMLEELLMIDGINEDLFYGFANDEEWVPGLEDVLTIHSLAHLDDPPEPENDVFRRNSMADLRDQEKEEAEAETEGGAGVGAGGGLGGLGGESAGVLAKHNFGRININTAHPAVLSCLLPHQEFGLTRVNDFLEWRAEQLEDINDRLKSGESGGWGQDIESQDRESSLIGGQDILEGLDAEYPLRNFDDLDKLEFMQDTSRYNDGEDPKEEWKSYLTTKSHVFSVTVIVWKPNRERIKVMSSILWRYMDEEQVVVIPLVPLRERTIRGIDLRELEEARAEEER